ncbi:O-fucosyltransferase 30 isoform X2 [Elaeis guineensis]|uniref:O-fucosyltransferase 30 isoform X2 n=1 Tax=Elaeis guineensis var. tenera TaxID=51953 RepID=A0A6I9R336_ELAGV|nr:O-fucosyltransferase 30 isoform X2 [Elaeis guineensis]
MDWPVSRSRWRKRSQRNKPLFLLSLSLLLIFFLAVFLSSYAEIFRSLLPFPTKTLDARSPQCGAGGAPDLAGERFLWYAPHSGFSNQLSELKNAILMAAILNRTLIVPPVLDHHAVALGSCPKFRVASPTELRTAVWDHIMELVRARRYVSMADIVDLSLLASSMVKIIDFRVFASTWSLLSGLQGNIDQCIYAIQDDCRTTVWTYQQENEGILDSFQPDKELQKKKKTSYIRKRRDVYKAFGPESKAETATILAFGSLFTSPYKSSELYIDIHEAPRDTRIQSLLKEIEFLPFVPEIMAAGKDFAVNKIKEPFLCAQLRLLDGQFKNHWRATFSAVDQKLKTLNLELKANKVSGPIHIFVMTDLPMVNWTGTYLADLAKDASSYRLYTLLESDELVVQAAKKLMAAEHGLRSGFLPRNLDGMDKNNACDPVTLPEILLYIEEAVCSCASLGFVGTAGSTIAESIEVMRRNNVCKL